MAGVVLDLWAKMRVKLNTTRQELFGDQFLSGRVSSRKNGADKLGEFENPIGAYLPTVM